MVIKEIRFDSFVSILDIDRFVMFFAILYGTNTKSCEAGIDSPKEHMFPLNKWIKQQP